MQPGYVVDMFLYFDEWSRCLGSRYQRDHLYRFGTFDNCSPQWKDLRIAMRAKMKREESEARALLETTYYKQNLGSDPSTSPTAGRIWELKTKPGWD